jgi:hypothetical protein
MNAKVLRLSVTWDYFQALGTYAVVLPLILYLSLLGTVIEFQPLHYSS